MAVTQQLARLTETLMEECVSSVALLDEVCSFKALKARDYLDLDWAPGPLNQAAVTANVRPEWLRALELSTSGAGELNPAYREVVNSVWEHPVASLRPGQVSEVSVALGALTDLDFLSEAIVTKTLNRSTCREHAGVSLDYLQQHFTALNEFYREAATRRLGVVMWWD